MKTILVTGGAGFIGSNFVKLLLKKSNYKIINLDLLTYAGNLKNLNDILNNERHIFIRGDICDETLVDMLFDKYAIDSVVNFAAESHVDRSIENAKVFLTTNIIGTQVLLDVAKKYWKIDTNDKYSLKYRNGVKFLQVSTDEVYGSLGEEGLFDEKTSLKPNSPYSVSKASADMLVNSYFVTYGFPMNISHCSNNYGPYQFPEKLIPLTINNCLQKKYVPLYGDGLQIRDWLHVEDHCEALLLILNNGIAGETYNIGSNNEKTNLSLVKLIMDKLSISYDYIYYVPDRLGHDRRYGINSNKIKNQLNWQVKYTFTEGIENTVDWYVNNQDWLNDINSGEYLNYANSYL